jgi:hypothetical protein
MVIREGRSVTGVPFGAPPHTIETPTMTTSMIRLLPGTPAPFTGEYQMIHADGVPSGVFRRVAARSVMPPTYLPGMHYRWQGPSRRRPLLVPLLLLKVRRRPVA